MSIRGAYGFYKCGENKITYNHSDSYPDVLGKNIVDFIVSTPDGDIHDLFDKIELIDERESMTEEQIEECKKYNGNLEGHEDDEWYNALRLSQGHLEAYKDGLKYMLKGYENFISNSLECEYAYVLNIDSYSLEFYVGGNKRSEKQGRYKANNPISICGDKYYGCRLAKVYPFDIIRKFPDNVIKDMKKVCED